VHFTRHKMDVHVGDSERPSVIQVLERLYDVISIYPSQDCDMKSLKIPKW